MLSLKNITAGYNGSEILHGVDLEVKTGEIVALIGPNGAGKSTILRSIFNLADVKEGKIIFKDKDITGLPTHELIQLGISYVPQGRQIFPNMTVDENLQIGAFVFKDKEVVQKAVQDVFHKFPFIKEKRNLRASTLSGGQQQALAIARSLVQDPELLLMDEPSLGLSPKIMKEIFEDVVSINKEGVSIMIVEQNAKQAVNIAHKTYVLENGRIAFSGGREVLDDPKIKTVYLGG